MIPKLKLFITSQVEYKTVCIHFAIHTVFDLHPVWELLHVRSDHLSTVLIIILLLLSNEAARFI